ncbi:DNA-binding response regulator [bacterium]|nr:MAG: DNA-binding response regulator [bacterium]
MVIKPSNSRKSRRPDVMLMDYSLPYMNGPAAREIKNQYPGTRIVILSMFAEDPKKEATQANVCLCLGNAGQIVGCEARSGGMPNRPTAQGKAPFAKA